MYLRDLMIDSYKIMFNLSEEMIKNLIFKDIYTYADVVYS